MTIKSHAASVFVLNRSHANAPHVTAKTRKGNERRGAALVLILILLPALIGIAAFAINLVHIQTMNTDVQIAADAAAKSAAIEYAMSDSDKDLALQAARDAASRNLIGTKVLPINAQDLEFGTAKRTDQGSTYSFTKSSDDDDGPDSNAIRVVTKTLSDGSGVAIKPIFLMPGDTFRLRSLRESIAAMPALDLAIVVDRSGSMAYGANETAAHPPNPAAAPDGWTFGNQVPPQARWLDLVAALGSFRNEMDASSLDDQVSLTVYNEAANTPVSLTGDYDQVFSALDTISYNFTSGGTNVGGGMNRGADSIVGPGLGRSFASKVAIVMTDGIHNYGTSPWAAASSLKSRGITVYTVTFSDEANQTTMKNVAAICGGQHFHATTGVQLQQAFRDIARSLPNLIVK